MTKTSARPCCRQKLVPVFADQPGVLRSHLLARWRRLFRSTPFHDTRMRAEIRSIRRDANERALSLSPWSLNP
jgi:hypothetical protein